MDCSTLGFPDFTNSRSLLTHVHWVGDASIQPSCPLSPPSPPASSISLSIAANTQWLKAATILFLTTLRTAGSFWLDLPGLSHTVAFSWWVGWGTATAGMTSLSLPQTLIFEEVGPDFFMFFTAFQEDKERGASARQTPLVCCVCGCPRGQAQA